MDGMDQANALRFDPAGSGEHVESYFLKANAPDGRRALWIKHTVFAPPSRASEAVAEVWAIAFDRDRQDTFPIGGKMTVPFAEARVSGTPFEMEAAGCVLRSGEARGSLEAEGHRLRWDLRHDVRAEPFRPFPADVMYRAPLPKTKTVTPCPHGVFSGEVEVDGEAWSVDGWLGMQGHNWGRGHMDAYAWAHCNAWDGDAEDVWFEGFAGQLQVGPVSSPWICLAALHVDGRILRFDGMRSLFASQTRVGFDRWSFRFQKGQTILVGEITAEREGMAGLRYANPKGPLTHCLNSKLARGRLRLEAPGEPTRELTSDRFALEIGTHQADHGVRMVA